MRSDRRMEKRAKVLAAPLAACGAAALSFLGLGTVHVAGAQAPEPAHYTWQAPGGAWTAGQRVVALTFDDGPGPSTPKVLSVLEKYHVPATFFEVGVNVAAYPQYTKMVVAAGDPVENHTWSHAKLATLTVAQVGTQIDAAQREIRSVTGYTPDCLRPPNNSWNSSVLAEVTAEGMTTMSYSVDPDDWAMPGVTAIVNRVVGAAFPGAVVDMHDAGGTRAETVAALPRIITDLRSKGYAFVPVCEAGAPGVAETSAVYAFGKAPSVATPVTSNAPYVGATGTASGYWLAAADGGVFSFGAPFYGSMGGRHLNRPVVGMAATPDGHGYRLVAADGGIFSFGDARFHGSMGGRHLDQPVVGMAADRVTGGYWEVAADGGVFSFGAPFYGSAASQADGVRFFAMVATPGGTGYLLAGEHPANAP